MDKATSIAPVIILLVAPKDSGKTFYAAALARMALRGFSVLDGWRIRCNEKWIIDCSKERKKSSASVTDTPAWGYHQFVLDGKIPLGTDKDEIYYYELYKQNEPTLARPIIVIDLPGGWIFHNPIEPRVTQKELEALIQTVSERSKQYWAVPPREELSILLFCNSKLDRNQRIDSFPLETSSELYKYISASRKPLRNIIFYYPAADWLPGMAGDGFRSRLIQFNHEGQDLTLGTFRDYVSPACWLYLKQTIRNFGSQPVASSGSASPVAKPIQARIAYGSAVGACPDGTANWVHADNPLLPSLPQLSGQPILPSQDSDGGRVGSAVAAAGRPGHFRYRDTWEPMFVLEPIVYCCLDGQQP